MQYLGCAALHPPPTTNIYPTLPWLLLSSSCDSPFFVPSLVHVIHIYCDSPFLTIGYDYSPLMSAVDHPYSSAWFTSLIFSLFHPYTLTRFYGDAHLRLRHDDDRTTISLACPVDPSGREWVHTAGTVHGNWLTSSLSLSMRWLISSLYLSMRCTY